MDLTYPDPELSSEAVRIRKWMYGDLNWIEAASSDLDIPQGTTIPAECTEAKGRAFIERQWSGNDDGQMVALHCYIVFRDSFSFRIPTLGVR